MSTIKSSTTTTTAYSVEADTTGALVIQTGATPTTAVTIDTSQGVGVGIATPRNFEVSRSDANTSFGAAAAQYPVNIRNTNTTANNWASIGFNQGTSSLANPVSIGAQFASTTAASFVVATSGVERMRVDSSGNVGVGATPVAFTNSVGLQVGTNTIVQQVVSNQSMISANAYYAGSWKAAATITGYAAMRLNAVGPGVTSWHQSSSAYTAGDALPNMDGSDIKMSIDASGVLSFNSGYGSSAKAYGCRAWVNFNGTGTVAIRASGNVTSITDNGVGDYTVNFTTAMPDTNYSNVLGCNSDLSNGAFVVVMGIASNSGVVNTKTTTALRVTTKNQSWNFTDGTELNVAVFR